MSQDKEVTTIEIPEVKVENIEQAIDLSTIPEEEQAMAKELGLIPKEELDAEGKPVAKKEESKVKKTTDEEEKPNFEDVEKNEKSLLGKFTKNEQGIYFRWKHDKKLRQEAQAERDLTLIQTKTLKTELDKAKSDGSLTYAKLDKINQLLTGPAEEITVEAIQGILKAEPKKEEAVDDKPLTKKDLLDLQKEQEEKAKKQTDSQKEFNARLNTLETYGKDKYENYDDIVAASKEIFDGKVDLGVIDYKDLARRFIEKVNSKDVPEDEVAEFVLGIAKLNPNFGKKNEVAKGKETKKVSDGDIDKIVKNAAKSQNSVSSGGSNRRVVNINDISLEDASKLSVEQYKGLPEAVKVRLRKEAI